MTDKNLKQLQDIIHDTFMLQSRIHVWMCHIVSGGEDGVTWDVYPHQYTHLSNAREYIDEAINLMMNEIEVEMKRREQLKKCQQISKEDFEKLKIETLKREMNAYRVNNED